MAASRVSNAIEGLYPMCMAANYAPNQTMRAEAGFYHAVFSQAAGIPPLKTKFLLSGVSMRNIAFSNLDLSGSDFSNAEFLNVKASSVNFSNSDFNNSIFSGKNSFIFANFENGNFTSAKFNQEIFAGLYLQGSFESANLKKAILKNAVLGAEFSETDFSGANLQGAKFYDDKNGGFFTNVFRGAQYNCNTVLPMSSNPASLGMIKADDSACASFPQTR